MLELFLVEFKRIWIEFIRYPVEAVSGIIISAFICYGFFLSTSYISGPTLQFSNRLDAVVVGYILWTLVTSVIRVTAFGLQVEAQTGTIEQLFLSPFGTFIIFLMRTLASMTLYIILTLSTVVLVIILTKRHLYFPPTIFLPFMTLLLGAYGLAFVMGALGLIFKRIQQLYGLLQFALLFLLTVPTETWNEPLLHILNLFLPMTTSAGIFRDLMARNQTLNFLHLTFALFNGIGYFVLGILVFNWAERKAKNEGFISWY